MTPRITISVALFVLVFHVSLSQSVGIGTETPNSNAILELVAPNNDQGLLVPRMSTAQRTATTFTSNLSASDNGLMVFDEDENVFYFWISDQWVEIATGNLSGLPDQSGQAGKFLSSDGSTAQWSELDFNSLTNIPTGLDDGDDVDDADNDPSNEIQDITSDGTSGNISLSDGSTLTLNVSDDDHDATNELQELSLSGSTLSLTGSTATVDLTPFSGTNTDEQDLDFTAGIITLSGDPDATSIDLSNYDSDASDDFNGDFASLTSIPAGLSDGDDVDDADSDATNEIQDISTDGTTGNISLSDGSTLTLNVDDDDHDATNELQELSLSGSTLSLTGSAATVDLTPFSGTNTDEQDLDFTAGIITLSGDPDATSIDLSGYDTNASDDFNGEFSSLTGVPADLTDGDDVDDADNDASNEIQDISTDGTSGNITLSDGSTLTLNVDDGDSDSGNELQDLSLAANTLSLSGSATDVDLSSYLDNSDEQDLDFTAGIITLSGDPDATAIDLSGYDTDASDDFDGAFSSLTSIPTGLSDGDDVDDADNDITNEIQDISTDGTAGNLSISDGSTITLNVEDGDSDASNEYQDLSLSGNTLSLTNSTSGVDLSPFMGTNTDNQTLSLSGSDLTISGGNTLDISSIDTDTDTQLSETEVDAFVSNNGYLTAESQDISLSGSDLSITGGSTIDLSAIDTDTDTQLSEAEVDAFVGNNGYLTTENQDISLSGSDLSITGGSTIDLSAIDTDTDTQLSEAEVDAFVGNNGYLTTENQDISLSGSDLSITGGSTIDLSAIDTDTDTQLSESEVDAFVGNNGYLTTENQDISLSGSDLSITGGSTIDLSAIDTDTDTQLSESEVDAFVGNNGYLTTENQDISLSGSDLSITGGSTIDLSAIDTDTQLTEAEVEAIISEEGYLTAEGQDISLSGTELSITGGSTIDLAVIDTDTDTQLSESEVDAFVGNNGYLTSEVDGSTANELNTGMSLSGTTIRVTDAGGTQSVNIGGMFATDAELASVTFTPAAFKATIKNQTTIPGSGSSVFNFDAEIYDISDNYDGTNTFSIDEDGLYNFSGLLTFASSPLGAVRIEIIDGEANVLFSKSYGAGTIASSISFSVDLFLSGGDKVALQIVNGSEAFSTSGSPSESNFFFSGRRFN